MAVVIRREDDTAIGHLRGARNMDTPKPLIAYQPFGVGDIATIDHDAVRIMSDQDYRERTMKDRLKEAERLLGALAKAYYELLLFESNCPECDAPWEDVGETDDEGNTPVEMDHAADCPYDQARAFLAQKGER